MVTLGVTTNLNKLLELIAKTQRDKSDIECKFYESPSDVLDPKELSSDKKNLMVFDDLLLERQPSG